MSKYDGAANRYVRCGQAEYLRRNAFDRECIHADGGLSGNRTLFVLRERGEQKLRSIEFTVYVP